MNRDEVFPVAANIAPPGGLDEAVQRIASGKDPHGLMCKVFGSTNELRLALRECGYNMSMPEPVKVGKHPMLGTVVRNLGTIVTGGDYAEYAMLITEIGESFTRVDGVIQTKKGVGQTPEDFKALKDVTG
jgi:hypothetical protein